MHGSLQSLPQLQLVLYQSNVCVASAIQPIVIDTRPVLYVALSCHVMSHPVTHVMLHHVMPFAMYCREMHMLPVMLVLCEFD